MKKVFTAVFFCILYLPAVSAQNECADKLGNFTFVMPDGWTAVNLAGVKYKIAAGLTIDGFTQNISVMREKYSGAFDEYIKETEQNILNYMPLHQIIKKTGFNNDYNIPAEKFVFEIFDEERQNNILKQYLYIFQTDGICFLFTCSVRADEPKEIEDVFDESMRTFHTLHKEM